MNFKFLTLFLSMVSSSFAMDAWGNPIPVPMDIDIMAHFEQAVTIRERLGYAPMVTEFSRVTNLSEVLSGKVVSDEIFTAAFNDACDQYREHVSLILGPRFADFCTDTIRGLKDEIFNAVLGFMPQGA